MTEYTQEIRGAKGGSSTKFRNTPDNLRSTDTFEALLGLITGPIRGLAPGGLKNYFIDDVPMEDGSGNKTLEDFNISLFTGDPTILEPVKLQLGGSSGSVNIGLAVDNDNPSGPGDWRFGAVTTPNVDFIDLRFIVNQLFKQDKNGIYPATASLEIELQPSGSATWINPFVDTGAPAYNEDGFTDSAFGGRIFYLMEDRWSDESSTQWATSGASGVLAITGKTSQNYVKELRISVPNDGIYANKTWNVRVRLVERDSYTQDENEERRGIVWESIAGVISDPIGGDEDWRGVAYLQISGKASDQLSGIPKLEGIFDLCTVKVPPSSVWNAEDRTYTGAAWDGATEEIQWTQCPAFQLKDLIEDDVSGISALVPGSTLNKWDALSASKWYAQRVPDGKGGMHPRYSMNFVLNSPMAIHETVQYIAGATGSFAWDRGDGQWRLVVEKPENPVSLFTKENISSEFIYSHTDIDSRYNEVIGVFLNEDLGFIEDRVRVFDQDHIDLYGKRTTSFALIGCTNRQEALRRCMLRMLSSLHETKQVSFVTNRQASLIRPFSVILVADSDLGLFEEQTTGRIIENKGTKITFRDRIRLELGIDYKLQVTVPNPNYMPDTATQPTTDDWNKPTITILREIINDENQRGDVHTLYLDEALPADTPENAPIALQATGLPAVPKQYRVVSIEPVEDNDELVNVAATEIYTAKWDESDAVDESAILGQEPNKTVPMPENMNIVVDSYQSKYQTKRVINVQWDRPLTYWFKGFKVEYRFNGGPAIVLDPSTQNNFIELPEPLDGVYEFLVYTQDRRGGVSLPLTGVFFLGEQAPPGSSQLLVSDSAVTIQADAGGVPITGQLPYNGWAVYRVGDTDLSDETDWSITGYGCTATIDADGTWHITGITATGKVVIEGLYQGLTLSQSITTNLQVAPVPPAPPTGTPASTSVSVFLSGQSVTNTTYPSSPERTATVNSGANGHVNFSAFASYTGTLNRYIVAKIVYRPASGGAWTDATAETFGSTTSRSGFDEVESPYERYDRPYEVNQSGDFYIPFTILNLTANTDYEFGVQMRISGLGTLSLTGSSSAAGNAA